MTFTVLVIVPVAFSPAKVPSSDQKGSSPTRTESLFFSSAFALRFAGSDAFCFEAASQSVHKYRGPHSTVRTFGSPLLSPQILSLPEPQKSQDRAIVRVLVCKAPLAGFPATNLLGSFSWCRRWKLSTRRIWGAPWITSSIRTTRTRSSRASRGLWKIPRWVFAPLELPDAIPLSCGR